MNAMNFTLVFFGGVSVRYRKNHQSIESARAEAKRVLAKIANAAAHPAIIRGDGLPADGIRG
jgi:hypothetical protein